MMQNELITKSLADVGEDIGQELGSKMVKDYQDANPNDTKGYLIGRNIIDQILSQPGCVGIRFYNALNESGKKTLVYVGIDENDDMILNHTSVTENGAIVKTPAIVADRNREEWGWFSAE